MFEQALTHIGQPQVLASLPYSFRNKFGLTIVEQPQLTQSLGPWLRPSQAKYAKKLGQEKDLLQGLVDQLPAFAKYHQNWHYSNTNWLPFYWRGFEQATGYTYVLNDLGDEKKHWDGFQTNIRTDIRKAIDRHKLVVSSVDVEEFIELNKMVFSRQGMSMPYSESLVRRIDAACDKHNARKIFVAKDDEGRSHAGVYIIWDENSAYYLMGGGDPDLRNSGATSLCMWEAIKFAATVTKRFDFEGSMLEPVERFFRAFGATQTPYFVVTKTKSRLLRVKNTLQALRR